MAARFTPPQEPTLHMVTDAASRAADLCRASRILVSQAAAQILESRRWRRQRQAWRSVCLEWHEHPDQMVACCAFCARVRLPGGEWVDIPAIENRSLHRSAKANLSHSFCPDCLARHFP